MSDVFLRLLGTYIQGAVPVVMGQGRRAPRREHCVFCDALNLSLYGLRSPRHTQRREMCALESFPYRTAHRRVRGRTGAGTSTSSAGTSSVALRATHTPRAPSTVPSGRGA